MSHEKDSIRREMVSRRKEISQERRRYTGKVIAHKIVKGEIKQVKKALWVSTYLSTHDEIPTRYVARALWDAGRGVCVPAWNALDQRYQLCELHPTIRLVTGKYGIREPLEQVPVMLWNVDVFILPGLAFDKFGGRLGFGKGIYDSILFRMNPISIKIGVCYDWQILDSPLPLEPHDISLDWIVSDRRTLNCKQAREDAGLNTTGDGLFA